MESYKVVEYTKDGKFIAVISGMGRNRGTLDSAAGSRRTARRWAAQCRKDDPEHDYRIKQD